MGEWVSFFQYLPLSRGLRGGALLCHSWGGETGLGSNLKRKKGGADKKLTYPRKKGGTFPIEGPFKSL